MSTGSRVPLFPVPQDNNAAVSTLITQRLAEYERAISHKTQLIGQLENRISLLVTEAKLNHEHHSRAVGYLENIAQTMTLWKNECNQRAARLKVENTELRNELENCRGEQRLAVSTFISTVSQLEVRVNEIVNELRLTNVASSVIID